MGSRCPYPAAHSLHIASPLPSKHALGPKARGGWLSTTLERQTPPGMLQTELLSLVCLLDKCGLPSGCLSPLPPPPFRKYFPPLKGEGLTTATCVSAADSWSAQAMEGGASQRGAEVTEGTPPGNIFFSTPQPHPSVTPQGAHLLRVHDETCAGHAKHHPWPLPLASLGEGGKSPPLWSDTNFTIKTELPGFCKGNHIINSSCCQIIFDT